MKNKLCVIGYLGDKRCYLNISKEAAIGRYIAENPGHEEWAEKWATEHYTEFEFEDAFDAYDVTPYTT